MSTPRRELPPRYDAAAVEPAIYERWEQADAFRPAERPPPGAEHFVVIQPPPNVTGALHIGHALTFIVEDVMVRYHRMRGDDTLWLPGVDHSGIGAQFVLDQMIAADGESRASLGRERYLERMWQFMDETRPIIRDQLRRFGASLDWSRERFTMDEGSARAVRVAFKRLWDAGLVYRGEALVNWCPRCLTTISDLENVHREETGTIWTIRYHLEREDGSPDPDAWISVATTRPETLLGRHRGGGPSRGRALPQPRRPSCDPAVPRPAAADRRRRARRAHVRHRRGEDHARARRRRLRARQAPRAAGDQRPRRRGAHQQCGRRVLRTRSLRGPRGDPGPAP